MVYVALQVLLCPALSKVKASGHVLTDSKQVGEWGAPTYDLWVVRKDFAEKNPEFLKAFVQTSLKQIEAYNQDPKLNRTGFVGESIF